MMSASACQRSLLREENIGSKSCMVQLSRVGGPTITHVMYADDIVLFSKACRREAANINHFLETYYSWSGQTLNISKSGVFFSNYIFRCPIVSI